MMPLPLLHRYFPLGSDELRKHICQIDLVINWGELKEDYLCRHLRITNKLGEVEWVAIDRIVPSLMPLIDHSDRWFMTR